MRLLLVGGLGRGVGLSFIHLGRARGLLFRALGLFFRARGLIFRALVLQFRALRHLYHALGPCLGRGLILDGFVDRGLFHGILGRGLIPIFLLLACSSLSSPPRL